jgi:hypothetical protein
MVSIPPNMENSTKFGEIPLNLENCDLFNRACKLMQRGYDMEIDVVWIEKILDFLLEGESREPVQNPIKFILKSLIILRGV